MKLSRNVLCPCGSGRKYKQCCLARASPSAGSAADLVWRRVRRANEGLVGGMLRFVVEAYGDFAVDEAWDEFQLWVGEESWEESEQRAVFFPWMLHRWAPDEYDTQVPDKRLWGVSPTQAYLDRRAKRLDPVTRRYLESCLVAPFSFYEITDVAAGHHFSVRELMLGADYLVLENSATRTMRKGDLLYGSLAKVDGICMLEACSPVVLPPIDKLPIIELRKRFVRTDDLFPEQLLLELDAELREVYLDLSDAALDPVEPEPRNSDGDKLSFQQLVFDIDSPQEVFGSLKNLALDTPEADLLAGAVYADDGSLMGASIPWLKKGSRRHKAWSNTSLGDITIDRSRLTVRVNSAERAARFRRIAKKALGKQARYRATTIESAERSLIESNGVTAPASGSPDDLLQLPEVQAKLREMLAAHYENWVSDKLPTLGGQTPLEAVKDVNGKAMVEALVTQIERDGPRMVPPLDEEIPRRLRKRLGLSLQP